ncbi:MAG: molybdopterin cofactor-binding domain-containing protein, partial [Fervidicoccaceae archaeon]
MYVGKPLKPFEHYRFITGRGRYVDDIKLDNMAYLKVIRSPYARALIRYIGFDSSRALLFIRPGDIHGYAPARVDPEVSQYARIARMPVLPRDVVNFVGQPVAAIVARDPYEAEDLAEAVSIDYEVLEPVVDPIRAFGESAPQIHRDIPRNLAIDRRFVGGDTRVFRDAEVVVKAELRMERVVANPIEPKACIAYYDGSTLTLYINSQSPHRVRSDVQEVFGISPEDIRVISPDVGGAFGNKTPLHVECILAIYASMKLKIPVKYVETRREHLVAPYHGRGVAFEVEGYGTRRGELLGIKGWVVADIGAYSYHVNLNIPVNIIRWSVGPYRIRAVDLDLKAVYTNKTPIGPYRGAGRPEAALIHERVLDALADEL